MEGVYKILNIYLFMYLLPLLFIFTRISYRKVLVLEGEFVRADEPLSKIERKWVETIKEVLNNENLRGHYSALAKERAKDFNIDKILQEWERILWRES